jgi:hypothetical protein
MPSSSQPVRGPANPEEKPLDKTAPGQHRKVAAVERIKKVGEIEPDEQSRARAFRSFVDKNDEEPNTSLPSPFDVFVSDSAESAAPSPSMEGVLNEAQSTAVPSPAYSPPPDVNNSYAPGPESEAGSEGALPQSRNFWSGVAPQMDGDEGQPQMREKPPAFGKGGISFGEKREGGAEIERKKETLAGAPHHKEKKQEPSPWFKVEKEEGIKAKSSKEKTLYEAPMLEEEAEKEEPYAPVTAKRGKKVAEPVEKRGASEPRMKQVRQKELAVKESNKEVKGKRVEGREKGLEKKTLRRKQSEKAVSAPYRDESQVPGETYERGRGKKRGKEEEKEEIVPPSLNPLPPEIQPLAEAAAQQASPYLGQEAMSLFYQMVGNIIIQTTPPGISQTEFVLNNPAFASSKFFGSTITIEKYSTAPDSLNIRLTGSNEAVQAFNQNIAELAEAFRRGNFSFTIGRIDAVYSAERPLFRRKGKRKESGLGTDKGER